MGFQDWTEKLNEFQGINRMLGRGRHHRDLDSNNTVEDGKGERGISGGPQRGGGVGAGRGGWSRFDDDQASDAGSARNTIIRAVQIFFLFVAICINAALAATQKKWIGGPSGLVVVTFIVTISSLLTSTFLLSVPLIHQRTSRFSRTLRGINQLRPAFLLNLFQVLFLLVVAFTLTISSNTRGCKDTSKDPNAELEGYRDVLPGFCRTKRALTAFLWFAFLAWSVSLSLVVLQWRATRSSGKIPAFRPPEDYGDSEVDKEAFTENGSVAQHYDSLAVDEEYHSTAIPSPAVTASTSPYGPGGFGAAAAGRPSGTFYDGGRPFDDAPPTGYGQSPYAPSYPSPPVYEDPYERIRRERLG